MNWLRQYLMNDRGIVTVEFALAMPLLLLLFFGSLEIARVMVLSSMVERAGYEMAFRSRIARGCEPLENIVALVVQNKLSPMLSADQLTVTATSGTSLYPLMTESLAGTGEDGDTVRLEVRARIGLLSWLLPESLESERTFIYYYVNEALEYVPEGENT